MNAQDKAKELVNKYLSTGMMITQAKQCAIISVDEILNLCWNGNKVAEKYWQEVKQEIEKI